MTKRAQPLEEGGKSRYRITAEAASERADWLALNALPHEPALRSWLRRWRLDPGFEQDVVQESYCILLSHPHLSSIRNARAYLFTMAQRLVLQRLRRERVVRFETIAAIDQIEAVDAAPPADVLLSDREQLDLVRALIAQLPDRCRAILSLRKLEGLSQRETAERLGVSENVVEKQLARGLAIILNNMEKYGFERSFRPRREQDETR